MRLHWSAHLEAWIFPEIATRLPSPRQEINPQSSRALPDPGMGRSGQGQVF